MSNARRLCEFMVRWFPTGTPPELVAIEEGFQFDGSGLANANRLVAKLGSAAHARWHLHVGRDGSAVSGTGTLVRGRPANSAQRRARCPGGPAWRRAPAAADARWRPAGGSTRPAGRPPHGRAAHRSGAWPRRL